MIGEAHKSASILSTSYFPTSPFHVRAESSIFSKMMEFARTRDEHVAASLAALAVNDNGKRSLDDSYDGTIQVPKIARVEQTTVVHLGPSKPPQHQIGGIKGAPSRLLKPYPYFFYRDFSKQVDPDPLTPLTAPGRVPNFPAKMHSILSRPDLADVVAWMPHGRSWRVLKPREFEIRVIPTYFEHAKFSSFIRQANGWGFRRVTQGRDRNSYYHEMFLRGLPHLCKMMKRPGVAEKKQSDPEHEPDFYKISEENAVPEKADDESILLQCTLQGGPKARMPIYYGSITSSASTPAIHVQVAPPTIQVASNRPSHAQSPYQVTQGTFRNDHVAAVSPVQQPMTSPASGGVSANMLNMDPVSQPVQVNVHQPTYVPAPASIDTNPFMTQQETNTQPAAAPAGEINPAPSATVPRTNPMTMMPAHDGSPASQFAAGFAAATALSQQQFRAILGQALAAATTTGGGASSTPAGAPTNQVPQYAPPHPPMQA